MTNRIILVALAAACTPVFSHAAQFYVSPAGSDTAAGTSLAPWKTLQHAADVVGPGDIVTARAGSYVGFYLDTSGTAAAPIEFKADPGAVINQRNATTPDGINLELASYVVIDGFSVTGMPRAGVRSVGLPGNFAAHVTVRNVTATNNIKWGIFTGHVDDLLIESNRTSGSIDEHGIYVSNSGDRPVIRDNTSFDNHGSGIHMNGDLSQGGDGIISGAIVSGNRIFNNAIANTAHPQLGGGSGINMDGVQNSRIENNLVYGNHASGISLYHIDGAQGSKNNVVVNNTVYEASDGRWALNIQSGSTGTTTLNNILISDHQSRGAIDISPDSRTGFTSDYNAVISRFTTDGGTNQTLAEWRISTGQDMNSFVATAASLFVSPAGSDYHLLSTSTAKNTGTSQSAPPADLDGLPRKAGAAFDIGAYEFGALSGDYNRDGTVTAADYTLWRKTLGSNVIRYAGADGNGSSIIDQADDSLWRAHFGAVAPVGAGSSMAIPEPTSMFALWIAIMALAARGPNGRHH
jgi:parallel beta-helix repeat protein